MTIEDEIIKSFERMFGCCKSSQWDFFMKIVVFVLTNPYEGP